MDKPSIHRRVATIAALLGILVSSLVLPSLLPASFASINSNTYQNCTLAIGTGNDQTDSNGNYIRIDHGICYQTSYSESVNGKTMYPWTFMTGETNGPNHNGNWWDTSSGTGDRCGSSMAGPFVQFASSNAVFSSLLANYYQPPTENQQLSSPYTKTYTIGVTIKGVTISFSWTDTMAPSIQTILDSLTSTTTQWDKALNTGGANQWSQSAYAWGFSADGFVDISTHSVTVNFGGSANYYQNSFPAYPCDHITGTTYQIVYTF